MDQRRRPVAPELVAKREEQDRITRARRAHERYLATLEGAAHVASCRWFSQRCRDELAALEAEWTAHPERRPTGKPPVIFSSTWPSDAQGRPLPPNQGAPPLPEAVGHGGAPVGQTPSEAPRENKSAVGQRWGTRL